MGSSPSKLPNDARHGTREATRRGVARRREASARLMPDRDSARPDGAGDLMRRRGTPRAMCGRECAVAPPERDAAHVVVQQRGQTPDGVRGASAYRPRRGRRARPSGAKPVPYSHARRAPGLDGDSVAAGREPALGRRAQPRARSRCRDPWPSTHGLDEQRLGRAEGGSRAARRGRPPWAAPGSRRTRGRRRDGRGARSS